MNSRLSQRERWFHTADVLVWTGVILALLLALMYALLTAPCPERPGGVIEIVTYVARGTVL